MKKQLMTGLFVWLFTACCPEPAVVELALQKGMDPDSPHKMMMGMSEKDGSPIASIYPEVTNIPEDWTDTHVYYVATDFPQATYQAYKAGSIDSSLCLSYFNAWGLDTADYDAATRKVWVTMAAGLNAQKDTCFVFDVNGNCDFSDDTPLLYKERQPVAIAYERLVRKGEVQRDTAWVAATYYPFGLFLANYEVGSSSFSLGKREYTCKVTPIGFDYNSEVRVSISDKDSTRLYYPGQYALLGDVYYRIDSLSPTGTYLCLREEPEALSKQSLQIGFRPYHFETVTTEEDTLRFPEDFKGKYVLLDFWATGCGPCRKEIQDTYPGLYDRYKAAGFEILAIGDNTSAEIAEFRKQYPMDWLVVADRDHDRLLQQLYRIVHYPTLYLVDGQGKICATEQTLRDSSLVATLKELFPDVP